MKSIELKRLFLVLFCFAVLAVTLVACKSASVTLPSSNIEKTHTVTKSEINRDTVFETPKDSSYYNAWLECVNGKVMFKQTVSAKSNDPTKDSIYKKSGKYLRPPNVTINDNVLRVDCQAEAQKKFAKWKETYIRDQTKTFEKQIIPVAVEKELSWWQKTQIWCGRVFLGLIVVALIILLIKLFI